jgi:NAD(P)H dehydrogenase (quinone)
MTGSVLVIGSSGKTGRAVTAAVRRRGVQVRGAGRPQVDLVTGHGLAAALDGVDAVYHLAPNMHPAEVEIAAMVGDLAVAQGVTRIVFHSVLHPHDTAMAHHLRKAEAEQVIRGSGLRWTILQPSAYHQNLLPGALAGRIVVPYSIDTPFATVDLDDVAEVAAVVLTEPGHDHATYELAGPAVLSVREMTEQASSVLGRPVVAEQLDLDGWITGPGAGVDERTRADLVAMFRAYDRDGLPGNGNVLRMLLGREPTSWAAAVGR